MTSTPVKDVGSVLSSLSTVGNGSKPVSGAGFQAVFGGQTGVGSSQGRADNTREAVKKTPGDSLKAKDDHRTRVETGKSAEGAGEDLRESGDISKEKLEEIMEVLGAAATELMQQIADTFGVTMEELEGAMEELGMDALDVLDKSMLGELLLNVAGAQDAYELVTDGELYGSYQELMAKLEETLEQASDTLQMEPGQLDAAMAQIRIVTEDEAKEAVPAELFKAGESRDEVEDPGMQQSGQQTAETASAREPVEENAQDTGRDHSESERKEHHSLFSQTFQTAQFETPYDVSVQPSSGASDAWSANTRDIMRQIMDYMRIQLKPDTSSLEMQLHPENLGSLHIQIAAKGGVVTANFIAQNEAVKAALESQMVQLKESFEQQGVKVEAIEVTVQSHAFERNLDQGRGGNAPQEQSPRKTARTRRLDLNDSLDVENLEEEDALAAEMMAASGSQVDYTV